MKLPFALTGKSIAFGAIGVIALFLIVFSRHGAATHAGFTANASNAVAADSGRRSPAHAPPIKIVPSSTVDERLFLLRALNNLNDSWPDENLPADQLQTALTSVRQRATTIRDHLHDAGLDEQLTTAYDRFLGVLDEYTSYLMNLGRIERAANERSEKEASSSGFNAGYTGAAAGYAMSDNGYTTSQSVATAGLVALGTYLWDDYQKGQERDAAKREAMEAAQAKLKAAVGEYLAVCKSTASALSRKYGWKQGEAGFDESADYDATRASFLRQGNTDGLAQLTQTLEAKRPRDPFLVRDKAYFLGLNAQGQLAVQTAAAKECLNATALAPAGKIYDEFRVSVVCEAADLLDRVASREAGKGGWGQAFNAEAALAVQAWDCALRYDQDFSGVIRERKVWDLFKSGDLTEAINEVRPLVSLRQNDPQFSYNMACLLSNAGDTDNSLAWLKQAVGTLGYNNIQGIKTDPDLATVREKKANEIAELTAVRCRWKIDFGVFNDDMIVTNDSPFPLTHVAVGGTVTPNNKPWPNMLTVDAIAPGKSYTWSDAFSVPGSKLDQSRSRIIVKCDQGECQPTLIR